jgi:hypothetical protein
MSLMMKCRLGRPTGPSAGRGERPWDPTRIGPWEKQMLDYVIANPDVPRWLIAKLFGVSPSRLSVVTCSPAGQRYLASAKSSSGSQEHPLGPQR